VFPKAVGDKSEIEVPLADLTIGAIPKSTEESLAIARPTIEFGFAVLVTGFGVLFGN
jgi:hypothetical protein